MTRLNIGDVVRYKYDEDCVGVVADTFDTTGWIVNWGSVKHKDLRYAQEWATYGSNVTRLSQEEIDNLPTGFLELFDKYKPISLEEKICKKIKELDAKWEQRMAQKKAGSPTMTLARNVEAGTTSVSGQTDTVTASVVALARRHRVSNAFVQAWTAHAWELLR